MTEQILNAMKISFACLTFILMCVAVKTFMHNAEQARQEQVEFAEKRFQALQESYEMLDQERKLLNKEINELDVKQVQAYSAALLLMETVDSPLTRIDRENTAYILADIAVREFYDPEDRLAWLALIANESKFQAKVKSPAGARGIGQIMPKSATWYGQKCGLAGIQVKQLDDQRINASLSACIFKRLIEKEDSRVLALVAYNAGEFSGDLDKLKQLNSINNESANYVAKIKFLLDSVGRDVGKTRHP